MNREDFEILKDIVYLDNGATTQKPNEVIKSVEKYYKESNANPHRGAYKLSEKSTNLYDEARRKVKDFINAKYEEEIILTKNATEALNLIAYSYGLDNLKSKDEVVLSIMEHHSDLVPWQYVCKKTGAILKYMYVNDSYEIDKNEFNKITDKTKIVCITYVSNVTGTINPVKEIINIAHNHNAVVVVDATQMVPHKKVDVSALDADFLVFSGHKMLSPMGIGVLYGKKELLMKMNPFLMGGDMIEYVYEDNTTYAPLPNKFEAGTVNVGAAVGLSCAIDYLESIGFDKIEKYENELLLYARNELEKLDFIETYYPKDINNHSSVISFNMKNIHPHDIASLLDKNNICIRSGNHCAQPYLRSSKIDSTCRISIYFYNTKDDIDKLIESLKEIYEKFKKYVR